MARATQEFIDEIEVPSFYSHTQRLAMLKDSSEALRENGQQIAKLRGLAQDAEMTEEHESLCGRFEMLFQAFTAMQRQQDKIAAEARRLYATSNEIERQYAEFKIEASTAGYTVTADSEEGAPDA